MFNWFKSIGIRQGIFWAIMIYFVGAINDVLAKCLGDRLHAVEIAFFRFLFSVLIVTYPVVKSKKNLFHSSIHHLHIIRGILGAIALGLCCYSVNIMPLAENTTILFSEALFMLPLAAIFLGEKIKMTSVIATIIGFSGLLIMFRPNAQNLNIMALIPTIAALLFAIMNIIIKKMVDIKENSWAMLFYFGLYTTIISGLIVPFVWVTPNMRELLLLALLGIGANLIQLFIFLAYRATSASSISPIRYTELPFASLFGFLFFHQIPSPTTLIGAFLIILGTFVLSYCQKTQAITE